MPRIGQQPVDEPLVPVGRVVGHECGQVLGRGWQADEVEVQSAHQHVARGLGLGHEPVSLVVMGQEGVDGVPYPALPGGK